MRQTILRRLITSFAIALIGLAIHSTATGQTVDSAVISPPTRVADSCEDRLRVASERLDKTLDAYEKAVAAFNAATSEIAARKVLEDLMRQWLAVKDQIIAAQAELIKFYQKASTSTKSKLRRFFETVQKVLLVGAGIYLGRL